MQVHLRTLKFPGVRREKPFGRVLSADFFVQDRCLVLLQVIYIKSCYILLNRENQDDINNPFPVQ